jgi:hypothetical protein
MAQTGYNFDSLADYCARYYGAVTRVRFYTG